MEPSRSRPQFALEVGTGGGRGRGIEERRRGRCLGDPDRTKAGRAQEAMMKMQKIIIADLEKAFAG